MPSLPELEVYRTEFTRELAGQNITQVEPLDFRVVRADPAAIDALLVGHAVTQVGRYGKWLIFDTGAPEQFVLHLGLTGKLRLLAPPDELPRYACMALHLADGRRLVMSDQRHLGKIYVRAFTDITAEKNLGGIL